jgi:hypothetical protein
MRFIFRLFMDWLNADLVDDFQKTARSHEPEATKNEIENYDRL